MLIATFSVIYLESAFVCLFVFGVVVVFFVVKTVVVFAYLCFLFYVCYSNTCQMRRNSCFRNNIHVAIGTNQLGTSNSAQTNLVSKTCFRDHKTSVNTTAYTEAQAGLNMYCSAFNYLCASFIESYRYLSLLCLLVGQTRCTSSSFSDP